ncbi:MAG: hypothetical protein U9N35_00130 [Euryarchaeota archaeon]|nr:hypothetical protein [Euryarchaeota archaeon]
MEYNTPWNINSWDTGVLNTGAAETTLRNPSIQRSEYYKYVFTVDYTGSTPLYLIFDGEKKEMHPIEEGSNTYISSMPFSSGEHQYAFICDSAQLPTEGVYKIDEIDNYWILLNTLTRHFSWHEKEEKELKKEFEEDKANVAVLEELYNLQMDRIRVSAMIQGTLTRIQNLSPPQNFDREKLLRQLTDTVSEYSLFPNLSTRYSNLREYFKQIGEAYIEDAIKTYSELSSNKKVSRDPGQEFQRLKKAVNELKLEKETMEWSAMADASERVVRSAEELACLDRRFLQSLNSGIEHLYTGIAAFYGDEEFGKQQIKEGLKDNFDVDISEEKLDVDIPQKKATQECQRCKPSSKDLKTEENKNNTMERQGKTSRTSYSYTGYTTRTEEKERYGNTYRVTIDVNWGKLKNQPRMDYAVAVAGDASEECTMNIGWESSGCAGPGTWTPKEYTSYMWHQWTQRRTPSGAPCDPPLIIPPFCCKQSDCWLYHSCMRGKASFRNWGILTYTGYFLAGYEDWWEYGSCDVAHPQ